MEFDPRDLHHRASLLAEGIIADVTPSHYELPTPCAQWNVRQLLNHVVNGNARFTAIFRGEPVPGRDVFMLGDDPLAAFRSTLAAFTKAVEEAGGLQSAHLTPAGEEESAAQLVTTRFIELMVHSWDLSRAIGLSRDLDPELCEQCLGFLRRRSLPRGADAPFAEERSAPAGASSADRMAAFTGRDIS